ncbi:DUF4145 domain-containing protein [Haloferax prahovense]|uniref:DUF4145 domain-containing protein n=1 Tax=Haloferax prahovense TaxID=381852 RepID=UPI003C712D42
MPERYISPKVGKDGFHCPNCGVYAHQNWERLMSRNKSSGGGMSQILDGSIGTCTRCGEPTIWVDENMVYPTGDTAPLPHEDMPENVKTDFLEARKVVDDSPRSAAALLRLAMEKLTGDLIGNEDQTLFNNIGELVEKGRIDSRIQQALDSVRVTGNDMVHAGEIYEDDDRDTALRLFDLVNIIVRLTITEERLIEEAYSEIPENKMQGIENRDGN